MSRWVQFGYVSVIVLLGGLVVWQYRAQRSLNDAPVMGESSVSIEPAKKVVKQGERGLGEIEARLAIVQIDEENARLRKEVLDLRKQVRKLSDFLASALAEIDGLKLRSKGEAFSLDRADATAMKTETGIRLVDVNESLRLVVLDKGGEAGIRHGMVFGVVRGESVIGRIKVADVRDNIAGAEIEHVEEGAFPVPGDRVVLLPGVNVH
ncbi:MAG: hypothetical protein KJ626_08035 [Verrucomicrobia bacterium]|nr:hypothetical protein [Verrucomicrobiota bacterium]